MERRAWDSGCAALEVADAAGVLHDPEDLERLALCAQLTGREDLADAAWARAYDGFCDLGEVRSAARCAFWLGLVLIAGRGAEARGGAWIARARRLLDERGPRECPEWGYVLLPGALRALDGDDPGVAYVAFEEAVAVGRRFEDDDLMTLGRLGQGQAAIRLGESDRGVALLDEAMLAVETGRVSPIASGIVYCAVLIACRQLVDVRRAQEWTEAFSGWCEAQSGLVPFRGQCLVHRSEMAQLRGDWPGALEEAERAVRWLSEPTDPALGMAYYQRAELHRARGDWAGAEADYRHAAERGHDPHPGLALTWLAQGRTEAAVAAIRRAVAETSDLYPDVGSELARPRARAESLTAYVEIMVGAGELEAAERACEELGRIADVVGTGYLEAVARCARGRLLLAQGRPGEALEDLVAARSRWLELQAPYETARARELIGHALRALGDEETAAIELDAASRTLSEVDGAAGATTDRRELPREPASVPRSEADLLTDADLLTAREREVIRLVAEGCTNREIAERLVISDKTAARHLHNILTKLGLPNRAAAASFASDHHLR